MTRTNIRKLAVAGAAAGALIVGASAHTSASAPPETTPPGSEAPGGDGGVVGTATCTFCWLLTDGSGMTLYAFASDPAGEVTCVDDCAAEWPPLFVDGDSVPAVRDLDPSLFSLIETDDGNVLAINGHALYFFVDDEAPGDVTGQGVDDFFVVSPEGNLITAPNPDAASPEGTEEAGDTATTEAADITATTTS